MTAFSLFGMGEKKIFAQNNAVPGKIVAVKKCWWLKVNTKPVRLSAWDGAKFPHIAVFQYEADGKLCEGKRWISYKDEPPAVGKNVMVYIDRADPRRYAVKL